VYLRGWLNLKPGLDVDENKKGAQQKQRRIKDFCVGVCFCSRGSLTSAMGTAHGCVSAECCCDSVRQGAHRHLAKSRVFRSAIEEPHDCKRVDLNQ